MIIFVKSAAAVGGDENIGPAVVIIISHGHSHAEGGPAHTGFFGDVGESAITIVLVEGVTDGLSRFPEIAGAAVDQENVHPAVVVEIKKGAAGAESFRQIAAGRHRILVHPLNAAGRGWNFDEERRRLSPGALAAEYGGCAE